MLSRAIDFEVSRGAAERLALAERVTSLEARVSELEKERTALLGDVSDLKEVRRVLEEEVQTERDISNTMAQATWGAMEVLEGAVGDLGAVPPPRTHTLEEMDVTLGRLRDVGKVFLPAARVYGDHCAKVGWVAALASLEKAGCGHLDALATRSVAVATAEEVAASHHRTRRASNVLLQDFWLSRGPGAAMASLRDVQAQRAKAKVPPAAPVADPQRAADGDQV